MNCPFGIIETYIMNIWSISFVKGQCSMGMYICTVVDHNSIFFFNLLQYLLDFRLALMGVNQHTCM